MKLTTQQVSQNIMSQMVKSPERPNAILSVGTLVEYQGNIKQIDFIEAVTPILSTESKLGEIKNKILGNIGGV